MNSKKLKLSVNRLNFVDGHCLLSDFFLFGNRIEKRVVIPQVSTQAWRREGHSA